MDETKFPKKKDAEDILFILSMSKVPGFPQYITGYDDFIGPYESRYISSDFKNLNMDSVRCRSNHTLVNIEHHSSINENLLRRNYKYSTTIFEATGKKVYPYIYYTGESPIGNEVVYMNETNFFNPGWYCTYKIDGTKIFNNLKYKINNDEELNDFDILDLIWFPKYKTNMSIKESIYKVLDFYPDINTNDTLSDVCNTGLIIWAGRYFDEDELNEARRCLDMSTLELKSVEEMFTDMRFLYKMDQARNEGRDEGIEIGRDEGRDGVISKLLEFMTPQEISEKVGVPLDSVLQVQSSISN
ncbi:MAG: hypothetical protein IJP12_01745 [Methanobrevibacter sp.]|nr:hypothetical protein [Methanobrevibacter sp.]